MRLFAYYALHSFRNQLKKLLKTWVLIFWAVCVAFGVMAVLAAFAINAVPGLLFLGLSPLSLWLCGD